MSGFWTAFRWVFSGAALAALLILVTEMFWRQGK